MSCSSISRLPDSATRLLSSHMVVVTPLQLVKELLDNAIDAKATSIEILVSPNTISRVEVRDDGVGIHPDDYDALGRRGHTSKLKDIEELGCLVGKTLGFRGEALASANSMADITITTKISTEPVAAVLQLIPNEGGVLTQKSISSPVGTTVNVTNLFGRQPVREQIAIKEAKKTLGKIQELLRSYAMARPQLKLLFKVLQTSTNTWSYSPKRNATPTEAALQLFGIEMAANCLLKTFRISNSGSKSSSPALEPSKYGTSDFVLEALFINPNTDPQKVPRGHYFSVDGRPINAGRGITKRLLNIYVEHLKLSTLAKSTSDYFIRLDICCPPGTYDANIEPSKDNVLFSDEHVILDGFRRLCSEIYRPATVDHRDKLDSANAQLHGVLTIRSLSQGRSHDLPGLQTKPGNLDYTPVFSQNASSTTPKLSFYDPKNSINRLQEIETTTTFKPINPQGPPNCSQLGGFGDQGSRAAPPPPKQKEVNIRSLEYRDQIAGASQNPQQTTTTTGGEPNTGDHISPCKSVKTPKLGEVLLSNSDSAFKYHPLSPLTPEPPILRHIMAPPRDLDVPRSYKDSERTKIPTVPGGPYRSPVSTPPDRRIQGPPVFPFGNSRTGIRRHRREQLPWTPPSSAKKNGHTDTSQVDSTHDQGADGFKQTQLSFSGIQVGRRRDIAQGGVLQAQAISEQLPTRLGVDTHSNIHDVLSKAQQNLHYQLSRMEDGELRKVDPNREPQRDHLQPSRQRQPFRAVHTNTFRSSQPPQEDREPITTTLPIGDPRAYLLRRQKSMDAEESSAKLKKIRRIKSSLMPLENTPPEYSTHGFSLTASISSSVIDELVQLFRKYDDYAIYGTLVDGLDMSLADGRAVESQLQRLLTEHKENIGNGDGQIITGLQAALKGKGVEVAPTA